MLMRPSTGPGGDSQEWTNLRWFMKTLTHRKRGQNQAEGKCARPKTQADLKIPHNKDPNNHTNVSLGNFFL